MRALKGYLKMKAPTIVLLVLCALCVITINWLYDYPLNAIYYSILICAVLVLVVGIVGFVKFKTFTDTLENLKTKISVSVDELPEPAGLITNDYTELLKILWQAKQESDFEYSSHYKDLVDYYTIWAHQIKTPIQAMRLILQTSDEDTTPLELELMRIEQYVDMVLTYLKLDSNSSDLHVRTMEIDPIIKAAVRKNAKPFIAKKISLQYDECNISALTDDKWLQFAIEQILSNSLKYTSEGGTVSIYKSSDTAISIKDTGMGIAKEDLPRVFERGFTGYNGREDKKATGIGLFLCHEVLKKIGHTISIESEVGVGTTVTIDLAKAELDARD